MIASINGFLIWSDKDKDNNGINIRITNDGKKVWECKITNIDSPPHWKSQEGYLDLLLTILRAKKRDGYDYTIEINDINGNKPSIEIQERKKETADSTYFLKKKELTGSNDSGKSMYDMLNQSAEMLTQIDSCEKKEEFLEENLRKLDQDLKQVVAQRDDKQNKLFQNMAVILNSKSRKIAQLESKLKRHSDGNNESISDEYSEEVNVGPVRKENHPSSLIQDKDTKMDIEECASPSSSSSAPSAKRTGGRTQSQIVDSNEYLSQMTSQNLVLNNTQETSRNMSQNVSQYTLPTVIRKKRLKLGDDSD